MKTFLAVCAILLADPSLLFAAPPAAQLRQIRGEMTSVKEDGKSGVKRFELSVIVPATAATSPQQALPLYWILSAQGRGNQPWLLRYGQWQLTDAEQESRFTAPLIPYEHRTGTSLIPLLFPWMSTGKALAVGSEWNQHQVKYQVTAADREGDEEFWQVEGKGPASLKQSIQLSKADPWIQSLQERRFLGQGDEQELVYKSLPPTDLSDEDYQKLVALFTELIDLRSSLSFANAEAILTLQPKELEKLQKPLDAISARVKGSLLEPLVADATRDLRNRRNEVNALSALRDEALQQLLPAFTAKDLEGKEYTAESLLGKVTILHFWEYRDVPLEQPYGQVAYLDFLLRKWKARPDADRFQILGVHVDPDVNVEESHRMAVNRAKRLKTFMNLGFPILLDDGAWIKQLGDPRPAGGRLPLFLVIDPQGKIAEYHPDVYPVKGQEGLAELEALALRLLAEKKP